MKKIIFAGCSFTYGHGLWQYTKEIGLPTDDRVIHYNEFPESLHFMENNRFARLVSNHFGMKEILKPTTSGCDEVSLYFIRELFGLKQPKGWTKDELNYENIKCYMIAMDNDYQDLIENDEFIKERFIQIDYDRKTFNNFRSLWEYNPKLSICNDTDFFETPPKDLHPTLEWHKVIANSIIKKLESDMSRYL